MTDLEQQYADNLKAPVLEDLSTTDNYPKTLLIHNTREGAVWQVYHVEKRSEALQLARIAQLNAFHYRTLNDYMPDEQQTWEDWRETCDPVILKD